MAEQQQVDEKAIRGRVGEAYAAYDALIERLQESYKKVSLSWKTSKQVSWFQACDIGRKRICYFLPKDHGFLFRMVFNDKAVEKIMASDLPAFVLDQLKMPKKYPEGRLLELTETSFDLALLEKLIEIKYGSMK